jgi:phenylpropionate dioxygenase-like ring-hydroxylating dioxygenase large terminal subunit
MAKSADYKLGEFSFPRGWFAVANSSDIKHSPYNARYFGEDVVLFRGESGKVVMLSAYCPHMGTHLAACRTEICN